MTPERWRRIEDRDSALSQNPHELLDGFIELRLGDLASPVVDDPGIRSEQSVGANPAALIEAAEVKIGAFERDGVFVRPRMTGDLAENEVVAA